MSKKLGKTTETPSVAQLYSSLQNLENEREERKKEATSLKTRLDDLENEIEERKKETTSLKTRLDHVEPELTDTKTTLGVAMRTTVAPIISAVVYKGLYKLLTNYKPPSWNEPSDWHPSRIRKQRDRYDLVGLSFESEMDAFADSYNEVINERNVVAHTASGDDVIACLSYLPEPQKTIVRKGFRKLFGRPVDQWSQATPQQKANRIHNYSDRDWEDMEGS